jgi:hypothetical protein
MELTPTAPISIAIIGCGSRGLTVIERLCAVASRGATPVDIHVYEPRTPGPGLHSVEQPEYLMLNTVASQISMFPDQAALDGGEGREGPDFYQWCLRYKSADRIVRANEFLPRRWLGEYLAWTYAAVTQALPAHVRVIHHQCGVDNIQRTASSGFIIKCAEQHSRLFDWIVVTVGHCTARTVVDNWQRTRRLQAYPQPNAFNDVAAGAAVGIEGLGLCAMDALAGLTVGRGGHFVSEGEGLRYIASGDEPKLFMFSRSGLPYRTRPDIRPHRVGSPASIFTLSAVSQLRAANPGGLDFTRQVMPWIKAEMFAEYYGLVAQLRGEAPGPVKEQVARAFHLGRLESTAGELARRYAVSPLDQGVFDPLWTSAPVDDYEAWVKAFIEADLKESSLGLDRSPSKAAVEVWRSCREQLRRVVDNHGLTPESHELFFGMYAPLVNRLVAGPQKERHQELLALAQAGVLQWVHSSRVARDDPSHGIRLSAGDNADAITLDAVVQAHVSDDGGPDTQPAVIRQLLTDGVIHSIDARGGGIVVDATGKALPNLWVTGPIVEGSTYYNHYVPSSGSYSRAFVDAERIAREVLGLGPDHQAVAAEQHRDELALA